MLHPAKSLLYKKLSHRCISKETRNDTYKAIFLCFIAMILCHNIFAQTSPLKSAPGFEYYICINGIQTREEVLNLEKNIVKQQNISFFKANRYPVRYFLMKTEHPISIVEFRNILNNSSLDIEYYGEGKKARENAIVLYNKRKAL